MMESESADSSAVATKAVDLSTDDSLKVNIADALNEQDVVKFTVHTKTTLDRFKKREFQVTRQHEEFVWLHGRFMDTDANAGIIIPPCPLKPDFSQSHGKLAKLTSGDASMPQEELEKLKKEIQSEYLTAFQKTVAMHEVFLMRLVSHPVLREDPTLQVFLEYDQDLACKGRTKKEKISGFFRTAMQKMDSSFSSFKDPDEFFEQQKMFIVHYCKLISMAKNISDMKVGKRRTLVGNMSKCSRALTYYANTETAQFAMSEVLRKAGGVLDESGTVTKKLAAKEDLKMTDLLRYYMADAIAARDLMYRRVKAHQEMVSTRKKHEQAKVKGKKVLEAADAATTAEERYEGITKSGREELMVFRKRRLAAFRKGLIQYTQCQIRQAKEQHQLWKDALTSCRQELAK